MTSCEKRKEKKEKKEKKKKDMISFESGRQGCQLLYLVVSLDVSLLGCQFAKKNFPGKCKSQK